MKCAKCGKELFSIEEKNKGKCLNCQIDDYLEGKKNVNSKN